MATEAEFTIAASDFPLGSLFEDLPDAKIELERVIPTDHGALPYFWVWNVDTEGLLSLLQEQPALETVELIDRVGDGALFRATWNMDEEGVLTGIIDTGITLLSGEGTSEEWVFEFRADSTDPISAFQQYCQDHGVRATLSRLQALSDLEAGQEYDLTPEQREALVLAFNEGYYNDPRETDLEELAGELGITRPSVSARLQRGYRNLIGSTLVHESG